MLTTVSNIAIADGRWFSNFEMNKLQTDELNVFEFSKSGVARVRPVAHCSTTATG